MKNVTSPMNLPYANKFIEKGKRENVRNVKMLRSGLPGKINEFNILSYNDFSVSNFPKEKSQDHIVFSTQ